jgi:glycosyltransferase involved in cell wall biosynthesis
LPLPVIIVPAYQPSAALPALVRELIGAGRRVVVVDDGSGPAFRALFDSLPAEATVLRHGVNLGKGAALRTAMNFVLVTYPDAPGVITADGDGQHLVADILRVAEFVTEGSSALVLGVRAFTGEVPWRSRFGNSVTRLLVRFLVGTSISDTQTGLRGIPRSLMEALLRLTSNGYEFELDMLVLVKHRGDAIREVPIQTVYIDNNKSSHFDPIRDSLKIYFVLLRFGLLSLSTALLDNVVFFVAYRATGYIGASQVLAR